MTRPDDSQKLADLDQRIQALKDRDAPKEARQDPTKGSELGWRMVTELVAGLMIGLGIGYGLDSLFGTMPIFLILFVLLGFAAGINVMMRTAKEFQNRDETGTQEPGER